MSTGGFRALAAAGAITVGAVGLVGITATAAHADAISVNLNCTAYGYSGTDVDTSNVLQSGVTQSLSINPLSGPTEVNAGSTFTLNATGSATQLPATQQGFTIAEIRNIVTDIQVSGAASIGNVDISGGNSLTPSAPKSGNVIHLTLPGSQTGGVALADGPAGDKFFPGGGTVQSPDLTVHLTAGAAGTTISGKVLHQELDAIVKVTPKIMIAAHLVCDAADNSLGTVQVVTPPPPGAPDAVADVASIDAGAPVTVDVLANDVPNAQLPIDENSISITSNPSNGSVSINADHTITYTPNNGFSGTDSFDYQVCSLVVQVSGKAAQEGCDTATVTVTVNAPVVVKGTTTTTRKAGVDATQSTAATQQELPRTGSSSAPFAFFGLTLCGAGALAMRATRRRARAS